MEFIQLFPGYRTALADGLLVPDSPKHMTSKELYRAVPGSVLHLCDRKYRFAAAIYSLERKQEYVYTYAYQPEENWTSYTRNLTPESYDTEDYIFGTDCWFRVCVKRADGKDMSEEDWELAGKLIYFSGEKPVYKEKKCFQEEAERVAAKIGKAWSAPVMKLCLLADTHYTIGGTWEDTAHNICQVAEKVGYDAIIHLGDLTDGMLSKELTAKYVQQMIADLEECGVPVYLTPGNHDSNYFRNQSNTFTEEEMCSLYRLGKWAGGKQSIEEETKSASEDQGLDYYVDVPAYKVRMVFLSSFEDKEAIRYGYADRQLKWLQRVLAEAAEETRFLVFSHDAPLAKLDYWSFHIRNGERLLDILEECNQKKQYQIAGFFYGHTHADYIFEECSFPVISVGCAKLEYFTDKKPQGAVAWPREAETVTQELWDSLLIDFEKERLRLIRFGAGEDREVSFAKRASRYKDIALRKRQERPMKILAHRGASGHAPENTLAAFELADTLGADGIELDVQLSMDGVPVVIHDERVDRVSDGTGFVRDMTLRELKALNVNQVFPAYGRMEIPTLSEVYEWLKKRNLTVNLELKNSVFSYEGMEEKVLKLAEEKGVAGRILYSSFNHHSMLRLRQLQPTSRIAFLYSDGLLDMADYGARYHVWALHPSLHNMFAGLSQDGQKSELIRKCHERGIRVHVWTVNEEADMEWLRGLGVDAVITNFVEKG